METNQTMSAHKTEASAQLSPIAKRAFKYIEFDDDEELITEIRKHPIGLFFIWVTGFFITAVLIGATVAVALAMDSFASDMASGSSALRSVIIVVGLLLAALSIVITVITGVLYQNNVIFITNEKIAEVMYASIFNRRVFQLGIGNVEDATVMQRGILPRLFRYGNLMVETAGEMANPAFTYVPDPFKNSQIIIQAHESYIEKYGN